ncbi:hypothetical protein INS49_015289 [Diaporthe citri]|uniref:uncharacterized protein n=1 Tax=Diaporthe citri TaxID=83186 RepID=UPI001C80A883|nr:uncharacterized protein INS49_015289 [Diaporthe citri]KAG6355905.1 hypothetical protein INS49_015289 [Diaporthe citri]
MTSIASLVNALDGPVAGGDGSSWLGQGNPSNTTLDSDNNQMENLGPLDNSISGDRGIVRWTIFQDNDLGLQQLPVVEPDEASQDSAAAQKARGMFEARRRQWHVLNLIRLHLISAE